MKKKLTTIQVGKQGLTDNILNSIKDAFNTYDNVKISLLRAATRNKKETREIAEKICQYLGRSYTHRLVGFTIFIKKWRKARK